MEKLFLQTLIGILVGASVCRLVVPKVGNNKEGNLVLAIVIVTAYVIGANVAGAFLI